MLPGVGGVLEALRRADARPVEWIVDDTDREPHREAASGRIRSGGKRKGPAATRAPALVVSTKIRHLLVISSIPARGFSAAVSVFRGTPPAKPLDCKIGFGDTGDAMASARRFGLGRGHHRDVASGWVMVGSRFLGRARARFFRGRKNPASGRGSRVGKILVRFLRLPARRFRSAQRRIGMVSRFGHQERGAERPCQIPPAIADRVGDRRLAPDPG